MRSLRALAIALIIVVVLIIIVSVACRRRYRTYLDGYWVGDAGFLEQAGLKDLQLFVGPVEGGTRQGYLIMADSQGESLANQAIELSVSGRPLSALSNALRTAEDRYHASVDIEYEADSGGATPPMPDSLKLTLSVLDGTLTLYDDTKVWAFLRKDTSISASALAAYEEGSNAGSAE